MNTIYKKYVWLFAYILCAFQLNASTSSVAKEKPVEQHVDEIAIILVNDGTNQMSIRDKIVALYEKIKQVLQDFRNKPAQDPKKLRQTLELEILKLLVAGKITPKEIRYLKDNQGLIEKLSDRGSVVLVESIGNLSQAQTENNSVTKPTASITVVEEIIKHLAHVFAEITKIISQENKTLVDKMSTHIGHLKSDFEAAFQKSLMQCFTEQELKELCNFVKSPAFKKLLTNVPLLKEIFFKNLSPEIISKLKSLI